MADKFVNLSLSGTGGAGDPGDPLTRDDWAAETPTTDQKYLFTGTGESKFDWGSGALGGPVKIEFERFPGKTAPIFLTTLSTNSFRFLDTDYFLISTGIFYRAIGDFAFELTNVQDNIFNSCIFETTGINPLGLVFLNQGAGQRTDFDSCSFRLKSETATIVRCVRDNGIGGKGKVKNCIIERPNEKDNLQLNIDVEDCTHKGHLGGIGVKTGNNIKVLVSEFTDPNNGDYSLAEFAVSQNLGITALVEDFNLNPRPIIGVSKDRGAIESEKDKSTFAYTQYLKMLKALLPPGKAWPKNMNTLMHEFFIPFALELRRVDDKVNKLFCESLPEQANELIDEWEKEVGLPNDCYTVIPAKLKDRRDLVIRILTEDGGQNTQDYIDLVKLICGDTSVVVIVENGLVPFQVDDNAQIGADGFANNAVGRPLQGSGVRNFWTIDISNHDVTCETLIECLIQDRKPAQTVVDVTFS